VVEERRTVKTPVKFGKYYLLERISVGGMAEVFKAKAFGEAGFERLVAVKRILPSIAEDQEFIAMFVDEAKLAVQLTHTNIAQIFELGKVGEAYFIALEYIGGKDQRTIFERAKKRSEAIPVPMACYMVMKLCEGLDYAHNKKDSAGRSLELVHRDVSPQNILVSYDGEVKLIDFGIAKAASKSSKTQAGILKGKFGYMSPEQVRGLQIDRRSDIFAVGICLYELLTTERLFVGESDFSTLEKVRNVEITPPTAFNKKIPEELENIVLKALAKHPEDRYRTAMDLHDDLQSFMYTSGNFFARKDLSGYMHKLFDEEIRKEQSRDDEYRKFDSRRAAESEVFDSAHTSASAQPPPPPTPPNRASSVPTPPVSRSVQPAAPPPRPATPRAPVVSAQRSSTGGMGVGNAVAVSAPVRQSTGAMPVHVAAPAPAVPVVPSRAAEADLLDGFDDDESATQIMDKPADLVAAMQNIPRPKQRNATQGGASVPRVTGQLPALPSLPGRAPATTALGIAPPPATSLQPVAASAGLAATAPLGATSPLGVAASQAPPAPSIPAPAPVPAPGNFGNLAPGFSVPAPQKSTQQTPKTDWPAGPVAPPLQVAVQRKRDTKSTALLAFFGVIAVAAVVVIALQFIGTPHTGLLAINTTDGAEVSVNGSPVPGVGGHFEVANLPAGQSHHISVRKPGFEPLEQDYNLTVGSNALTLPLQPSPPPVMAVPAPPIGQQLAIPDAAVVGVVIQQFPIAPVPPVVAQPNPPPTTPRTPTQTSRPRENNTVAVRNTTPRERVIPDRPPPTERNVRVTPIVPTPVNSDNGGTGRLLMSTNPAGVCTISGFGTRSSPIRADLPPGHYSINCRNEALNVSGSFSADIAAGETVRLIGRPLQ
jgi:eukaryotic-like serine/threonine-protein kinase